MIPREEFERYDRALQAASALARAAVLDLAQSLAGVAAADLPAELARAYAELVRAYGSAAAAAAVETYRSLRAAADVAEPYDATTHAPDDAALLAWDVSDAVARHPELAALVEALSGRVSQRVMGYADETMLANARADPASPRWALVPHAGACSWCRLMASQGFVYASEATVARHDHCLCTPCVDFDAASPSLEGYDPRGLRDEYRAARREVESAAREEWAAMTKEERARYGGKGRGAYDHYLRNRIVGAMAHGTS